MPPLLGAALRGILPREDVRDAGGSRRSDGGDGASPAYCRSGSACFSPIPAAGSPGLSPSRPAGKSTGGDISTCPTRSRGHAGIHAGPRGGTTSSAFNPDVHAGASSPGCPGPVYGIHAANRSDPSVARGARPGSDSQCRSGASCPGCPGHHAGGSDPGHGFRSSTCDTSGGGSIHPRAHRCAGGVNADAVPDTGCNGHSGNGDGSRPVPGARPGGGSDWESGCGVRSGGDDSGSSPIGAGSPCGSASSGSVCGLDRSRASRVSGPGNAVRASRRTRDPATGSGFGIC